MKTIHLVAARAATQKMGSAIAGHALLSIHDGHKVFLFHYMGGAGSTNPHPTVEFGKIAEVKEKWGYQKVDVDDQTTIRSMNGGGHFSTKNKYDSWRSSKDYIETPGLVISPSKYKQIMSAAIASAGGPANDNSLPPSKFNVLLGALGFTSLGTNCITWAYQFLKKNGVTFSWTTWAKSFYSPRRAVEAQHPLQFT